MNGKDNGNTTAQAHSASAQSRASGRRRLRADRAEATAPKDQDRKGTSDDFGNLIHISTAQIVCFELATRISCELSPEEFAEALYRTPTVCIDGSLSCARARGLPDVDSMVGLSLPELLPESEGYRELFIRWRRQALTATPFEFSGYDHNRRPLISQVVAYGRIEPNEQLSRFWLVIRDLTPHMRAVVALAQTELHYRTLIETPTTFLARVTPSGYYEYVSPGLADFLGVEIQDVTSKRRKLCEWVHPADQDNLEELLAARSAQSAPCALDTTLRFKSTIGYRLLQVRQLPLVDTAGSTAFIDIIAIDVTPSPLLTDELHDRRTRKGTSQPSLGEHSAASNHHAALAAHDIRNLLTVCMGNLEEAMSLLDEKPATDVSRSLRAATAACTATRDIVGRLLSPATETESCDVASAISMLASLLKPVIPPGVTLTLSDFRPGLNIPISSSSLQNVLCNLILNARDAVVAQGGSIHVSTHYESQRNLVTIAVEDDGPGIAPEIAPLLFQLYTTSKHQSGGTGLGLASCREAIVAAGGTIDAGHSPSLGGALFTISLPCEVRAPSSYPAPLPDDSRQGTERAQVFAPPQEQQQLRVLVADDEDSIRELLTVTLARKGYAVAGVGDSQLLLSKLSEEPGRFDVVVVDDSLQRQGSAHLVSQLRALSPQTSIIVVSGDHSVREDLIRLQTNVTFLAKPFSLSDLEGAIRSSCGRRL